MTRDGKIFKILIPAAALLLAAVIAALPIHGEGQIYENVIRLHVIANSDSEEDQAIKLQVRDAVLSEVADLLQGCDSESDAFALIDANRNAIESAALAVLIENGFGYGVKTELNEEYYPRREYEGFMLPAGTYMSARVELGAASGQNWWCILFPPLCTSNAEKYTEQLLEVGFTPNQIKMLTESDTPKYKVKFRIVELLREWFR